MKSIWIASDHAGFELKQKVVSLLKLSQNLFPGLVIEVNDLGPQNEARVDYPDYADLVAKKVQLDPVKNVGILICGSGQGMCMRANRYLKVRACLVYNEEIAKLSRQHNDANVLCLGSRVIDHDLALSLVVIFFKTEFQGGRHQERVEKLEKEILC